jgi:hypothetical protein
MAALLNAAIYVGPVVLLAGLVATIICFVLQLFGAGRSQLLRRALVTAGVGIAGLVVGTGLGIAVFCSTPSTGNLCGLGGVFGTGPFAAGVCMAGYSISTLRMRRGAL